MKITKSKQNTIENELQKKSRKKRGNDKEEKKRMQIQSRLKQRETSIMERVSMRKERRREEERTKGDKKRQSAYLLLPLTWGQHCHCQ